MKMIQTAQAENLKNPHGVAMSKLYDTEHAQGMHIILKTGEALKNMSRRSMCFSMCLKEPAW